MWITWLTWMHLAAAVLFGLCGGLVTAGGYFAVINSIGMMNRAASVTRTRKYICLYEDVITVGVVVGTFLSLCKGTFALPEVVGTVGVVLYGLIAGMFIGLFVVSLAENVKVLPILVKRTNYKAGLGLVILCMALGKAVGHILYYVVLYR